MEIKNGKILAFIRMAQGMTQAQFADEVGISLSLYQKVELGTKPISKTTSDKVKRRFNVTDEEILAINDLIIHIDRRN